MLFLTFNAPRVPIKSQDPLDVNFTSYADYNVYSNVRDAEFKVGNHVRISNCKKILANGYAPNWSEEVFMISQIKNTIPLTYVINDLSGKKIDGTFYEKGIAED